jgi:hypothetical protein
MVNEYHYRPGETLRFQEVEETRFQNNRHMKVIRLTALPTGSHYPTGNIPGTYFC